jgi:hypothetical protein
LWLLLAFSIRACILPEDEYLFVNQQEIEMCTDKFYALYEELFGTKNCTYSVHIVASHLLQMRSTGPLTVCSAFPFEHFYGELRHSFVPGTVSPLKQILQTVILKRKLTSHCCSETIHYSPKDTALECNSLVYKFVDGKHILYKILAIDKNYPNTLSCVRQGKFRYYSDHATDIDWSSVGVYKLGGLYDNVENVDRRDISGKILKVKNYLITCPLNILREK